MVMSAARRIVRAEAPLPSSADLEEQRRAAEQAVQAAADAVANAEQSLAAAPRDPQKRSVARETVNMAREELDAAKASLASIDEALAAARRLDDEAAGRALADRVCRLAQSAAVDELHASFMSTVLPAVESWLAQATARRAELAAEAAELNAIWRRLGHGYRFAGVDVEQFTGTPDIPAQVSLTTLDCYPSTIRQRLWSMPAGPDGPARAAREFVMGALDYPRDHLALHQAGVTIAHLRGELATTSAAPSPPAPALAAAPIPWHRRDGGRR